MTVVYILSTLFVVGLILVLVNKINVMSESRYGYTFFTWDNLVYTAVGYIFIFFGREWYTEALDKNGDILNGQILIAIGLIIIIALLYTHIKNTSLYFGMIVGVVQLILYLPASVVGFFAALIVMAWLADTKPVVNLN